MKLYIATRSDANDYIYDVATSEDSISSYWKEAGKVECSYYPDTPYVILSAENHKVLSKLVNIYIEFGYSVQGGISHTNVNKSTKFLQSVYKEPKLNNQDNLLNM